MVGWHHRVDGHEFEQALGDGEGRGYRISQARTLERVVISFSRGSFQPRDGTLISCNGR